MNIKHRDMDDPAISAELFKLVPLPFRFAGLLAGAALVAAPQLSKADTVAETLPATQTSCLHSMNALVGGARGSATRIEISMPSPTSKMARIFVPDGEVRVVCDSVSHQMKLSRVLDAADDETSDELALNTQKLSNAKD